MTGEQATLDGLVRERAPGWLDDRGPVRAELLRLDRRANCELQYLRLVGATRSRDVVVKIAPDREGAVPDRPALNPMIGRPPPAHVIAAGLRSVKRGFADADPDVGDVVELIDELTEVRAVVLARHDEPNLRDRSRALIGARVTPPRLQLAYANTGRWMRTYHSIGGADRPVLRPTRGEAVTAMTELTTFLADRTGSPFWSALGRDAVVLAEDVLPATVEVGVRHDDCAPRNFLVTESGRVTGIDVTARWCAPVLEDLGQFVMAVESSPVSLLSRGRIPRPTVVDGVVSAFLGGYYANEVPWASVRWYELLMLLDRWSARVAEGESVMSGRQRLDRWSRRLLLGRDIERRSRDLLVRCRAGR